MNWISDKNTNLLVREGVVLNPLLDKVAVKLDRFFAAANHYAYVTSGIRTAEDQLRIIKGYIERKKIVDEFIENATVDSMVQYEGKDIYSWQLGWSKLLNRGVIINPPLAAEVLLDYTNSRGENRKGSIIQPSAHFRGTCLDIGGGSNTIGDETAIVQEAIDSKQILEIVSTVPERENNCLHLNLREV